MGHTSGSEDNKTGLANQENINYNEDRWKCYDARVCQNTSPEEIQTDRWLSLSACLVIAAAALYISFCRQSAFVTEAECVHQRRINNLWEKEE